MSEFERSPSESRDFAASLEAARRGDSAHLGQLLNLYRPYLLTIAAGKLNPNLGAKLGLSDLIQQTFLQATQAFEQFAGQTEQELIAWLVKILSRQAIDIHRHFNDYAIRDITREIPLDQCQEINESTGRMGTTPSASQSLRKSEDRQRLEAALEKLSQDHRDAIEWRNFDELSFEEIGQRMGRSTDAARKLWARAIESLTIELRLYDPDAT